MIFSIIRNALFYLIPRKKTTPAGMHKGLQSKIAGKGDF